MIQLLRVRNKRHWTHDSLFIAQAVHYERLSVSLRCATYSPGLICFSFRLSQRLLCVSRLLCVARACFAMPSSRLGRGSLGVRAQDLMSHEQRLIMLGLSPAASPPPGAASAAPPLAVGAVRKSPPAAAANAALRSPACSSLIPSGPHFSKASSMPPVARGRSMARRADAPVIKSARRGSSSKAIAALHSEGLDSLVQELYDDRTAKSAAGDKETHLATWTNFHQLTLGTDVPVIPVTVWSLVCVASLFKKGDYRSFNQYVSSLKGFHVEAGYALLWDSTHHDRPP